MSRIRDLLTRWRSENAALAFLGLGGATILIFLGAVLGAIKVSGQRVTTELPTSSEVSPGEQGGTTGPEVAADPAAAAAAQQAAKKAAATTKKGIDARDLPSTPGATRIGVTPTEVRWGLHAPVTFDGAPLPLAEDPLEGVDVYLAEINQSKVHGREVVQYRADDRYTVEGAKGAANSILNDSRVFFVSGTLGVDQVATVAAAARKTVPPTPYMAAGGSEVSFKDIGMYQVGGSYDTHLIMLADFLAKEVVKPTCIPGSCTAVQSIYGGRPNVAVVELDSKYIEGSVNAFEARVKSHPELKWVGKVKVPKFTDPSNTKDYTAQNFALQGMNAQIVVPATDPLTTSAMLAQCGGCSFKWSMSNFAHDSDTALALMFPSAERNWIGVRGLSSGCYYQEWNTALTSSGKCGALKQAHDSWVRGKGNPQVGEAEWTKDGQGGVVGYQLTHIWLKALTDAGGDLTRERFVAALATYSNFTDLVTSPITYLNAPNLSHGVEKMSVYEAGPNAMWRQFSDGLVGSF